MNLGSPHAECLERVRCEAVLRPPKTLYPARYDSQGEGLGFFLQGSNGTALAPCLKGAVRTYVGRRRLIQRGDVLSA